jgi:hypothetical protein
MRTPSCCLALATLAASATSARPALATDPPARDVRIEQVAHRVVGRCAYTTSLHGTYALGDGGAVRNAVIDVGVELACRGERPIVRAHEVYFASTSEASLLVRIAELAATEYPAPYHGATCAYRPAVAREGASVTVTDVAFACERPAESAAAGDAPAVPAPPVAHR